jgi:arginine decarboxylase
MEAQRNAAAAAVGSAFPVFELPSDASAMNGALNGDSVVQAAAKDA